MAYLFRPELQAQMVEFAKTSARDSVKLRQTIDWKMIDDWKKHLEYQTLTSPSASTELQTPGGLTYQIGAIKYADTWIPVWENVRAFNWSYTDEKIDQQQGGMAYKDTIAEIVYAQGLMEDKTIMDGAKTLGASYISGATGWIGAAGNTVGATAAWDGATANIHQDILGAFSKLNEDNIEATDYCLIMPKYEGTFISGTDALGLSVFDKIKTSFPQITQYVFSNAGPASTAVLVAKNPMYAQMFVGRNFQVGEPIIIDDMTYQIKIRHSFSIKIKETNCACTITGI